MHTDAELLAQFRAGCSKSFEQIIVRYEEGMYVVAALITGDEEVAEDVLKEVFSDLFRDPQGEALEWKLVGGSVREAVRRVEALKPVVKKIKADESFFQSLMMRLPCEYRTVFILKNVIGYSLHDIGEILLLPFEEVAERLERGCAMMCRLQQKYGSPVQCDPAPSGLERVLPLE